MGAGARREGCRCSNLLQTLSNQANAPSEQPRLPAYPIGLKTSLVMPLDFVHHFGDLDFSSFATQLPNKTNLPQFPLFSIAKSGINNIGDTLSLEFGNIVGLCDTVNRRFALE